MSKASVVAILLLFSPFLSAHHSSAMFDSEKVVETAATVTEFQWTNPHIWIEIRIVNDAGAVEDWSIEGRGPNSLYREGWRPSSFKPGDEITIRFNPMRDGSFAGGFIGARFADGHTIGRWTE